MGIRWVFAKLYVYGLLPSFVADLMNLKHVQPSQGKSTSPVTSEPSCCAGSSEKKVDVKALEAEEQFEDLLKKNEKFVVKFTASWCGPCKKIHPFYEQKSAQFSDYEFLTVDVDDFDSIAQKYSIAMMPTFIVVQGETVVGTCTGSSKPELDMFLQTHLQ
jgi:thioredoxin 1